MNDIVKRKMRKERPPTPAETVRAMDEPQRHAFIRARLAYSDEILNVLDGLGTVVPIVNREEPKRLGYRFDMSGYENKTGAVTLHNQRLVNLFADLGIYDYHGYFVLDFYKGIPTFYYDGQENNDFSGSTTTEIIDEMLKLTVLTGNATRRRI